MVYGVDEAFHAGEWIPDRDIDRANGKNRTKLQSVLRWTIVSVHPNKISLATASNSEPNETALSISVNVRQTWWPPTDPPRPLTICTANTILNGSTSPSIRLFMTSVDDESRSLLGDPLRSVWMNHKDPVVDDWKTVLPFATIPPEGITVTRNISYRDLFTRWGKQPVPPEDDAYPKAGEEYQLRFASEGMTRKEAFTKWWNWGDLEGDLRDLKLIDFPSPKVNPRGPTEPPKGSLLPFASWEDEVDEEGNWFVRLQVHIDTSPVLVTFVE